MEVDHDAIGILHRGCRPAVTGQSRSRGCSAIGAVEVLRFGQVVDLTSTLDPLGADVKDLQAVEAERVVLTLVVQSASSPAYPYSRGNRPAGKLDRRVRRRVICQHECGT